MKLSLDFENQRLKMAERCTLNFYYAVFLVAGSWEDRFRIWLNVISDFCVSSFFFFFQGRILARLFLERKVSVSQRFPVQRREQATLETMVSPQAFLCYFWMKESRKRYTVWEFTGILGKWHSIYKFGTDSKNTGIAGDMVSTYFLYRCIINACTKIKHYFLKVFKNSLRL